jgi:hypothetical protein
MSRSARTWAYRPRTPAQKARRLALKVVRGDEQCRLRYEVLKAEMAAAGWTIGKIRDLDEKFATDPVRRYEVLKARVERWEALWSIRRRKLETRAKIIIGAAVLAELATRRARGSAGQDDGFVARITDVLDRLVPRVRDRLVVRDLTGLALPLRAGDSLDETYEEVLAAISAQVSDFDEELDAPGDGDEEGSSDPH